ncbi:Uncharacterised protein [Staphylococcus agnetis]|nr:hypothetical protein [Staphylococcus agnetis]SUJ98745.1 Uncharacterised protein [Staphylococcus agnetis]
MPNKVTCEWHVDEVDVESFKKVACSGEMVVEVKNIPKLYLA